MNMSVVKREGRRMNTEIMNISGFSYKDIYHCNVYFDCSGEKKIKILFVRIEKGVYCWLAQCCAAQMTETSQFAG